MKKDILERIDSVVAGYVNQYASDWTEIDRPQVEKCSDQDSFLVMMRPSGVDVAFLDGEFATKENVLHSQAAVPNHELFLYYTDEVMQSVTRSVAQKLCDEAVARREKKPLEKMESGMHVRVCGTNLLGRVDCIEPAWDKRGDHCKVVFDGRAMCGYYFANELEIVRENQAANTVCDSVDLPMDGFRKAVERCIDAINDDVAAQYPEFRNVPGFGGECGSWFVGVPNRGDGIAMEIEFDGLCVAVAKETVNGDVVVMRVDSISDKTLKEIFDVVHSRFPDYQLSASEKERLQISNQDLGR